MLISRIVTTLEEAGAPLTATQLAERVGAPVGSVRTTLANAVNSPQSRTASRIERVERGLYGLKAKATDLGLTWHEAVTYVLEESSDPVHYRDITDEIVSRHLAARIGLTPARTVSAILSQNRDGRFQSVERGIYEICDVDEGDDGGEDDEDDQDGVDDDGFADDETTVPAVQFSVVAFGMYWRRDAVLWATTAKLLGVESYSQPNPIDFSDQRGLYLLHRGHQTVYVGKAVAQPLGKRISDHTRDRLSGRWDSFSWLGLREINDAGQLGPLPSQLKLDVKALISLVEFWLVEAVEPALNRKQGDTIGFDAGEYLQRDDPALEDARKRQLMSEIIRKF